MPKRPSNSGWKRAASSKARSRPVGDQRPRGRCRGNGGDGCDDGCQPAPRRVAPERNARAGRRCRTAGSAAAARRSAGSPAPCSQGQARTSAAASAIAERTRDAGAASDHDQDQQREDDGARRHQFAAQNARMHGDAAGEGECKGRHQRDAPVAHHMADQGQRKSARNRSRSATPAGVRREPQLVMAASKAATFDAGGMADSVQASSRPSPCSSRNQYLHRKDGDVGGVIEEPLRLAVVENKRVVDHHEIHVGVAPVDQRVAEQEKRGREAGDDRRPIPIASQGN